MASDETCMHGKEKVYGSIPQRGSSSKNQFEHLEQLMGAIPGANFKPHRATWGTDVPAIRGAMWSGRLCDGPARPRRGSSAWRAGWTGSLDALGRSGPVSRRACAVPKLAHGGWTAALCSLGCSPVLADQAVDDLPALDPGGHIDGAARLMQRRILVQRLVRPVAVIVPCELASTVRKCCLPRIST